MASIIPPYAEYIKTIARAGEAFNRNAFAALGLGATHADYIRTICRNAGISQEELAMRIGVYKSNVTRTLVQLEQGGYIERRQGTADRRCILVYPTDLAYELLPAIVEVQGDWRAILTDGFSPEEKEQLAELLERMEDNVRRHRLGETDIDADVGY
ncbi:MAG: MarR family transcriptional regulator [Clostridia bacterium]|nr:MarR family transcriptional regulator [Clostridia bacterium]